MMLFTDKFNNRCHFLKPRILSIWMLVAFLIIQFSLCESPLAKTSRKQNSVGSYAKGNYKAKKEKIEKLKRELPEIYANLWKAGSAFNKKNLKFYPLVIEHDPEIQATSDGKRVMITSGMIEILSDKDEAAMILSHEIAHTLLGHVNAGKLQKQNGTLNVPTTQNYSLDKNRTKKRRMSFVKKFEYEADYMGIYLMARAGYSIDKIGSSWEKISGKFPYVPEHIVARTHPNRKERLALLLETQKEIYDKTQAKQDLIPNFNTG